MHSVAHSWSREDPAAALAWVVRTASGRARYSVASYIFERWAASDSAAVVQQVAQLTDPMLRDIAALSLIANSQLDTNLAEQMYSRIENPEARRSAARQLYQLLSETDPPRAERYRRDSGTAEAPPRAE
ncbi:MAG: hypothetical protein HC872_07730 [Gammaproteobacteria bacterium]|nr:hypothetical protein [Gammaproteobacteria bacterium]